MLKSQTNNVFSILESYGADLAPHMVFVLKTSGYNSFRAIAKINEDKIKAIQTFIRDLFEDKSEIDELSKEEKISQFGPIYWNNVEKFTFTLGDIDSILAAVDVCKRIASGETLPVMKLPQAPVFDCKKAKKTPQRNITMIHPGEAIALNSKPLQAEPSKQKETQNLPKKTVLSLISDWIEKHGEVNVDKSNWTFNEQTGFVTCCQCKTDIGISVNEVSGQWRISNVTRHISVIMALNS